MCISFRDSHQLLSARYLTLLKHLFAKPPEIDFTDSWMFSKSEVLTQLRLVSGISREKIGYVAISDGSESRRTILALCEND